MLCKVLCFVSMWPSVHVTLCQCGLVSAFVRHVALCPCGLVSMWPCVCFYKACGLVSMWPCVNVALRLCGLVSMWPCDCMALCPCGLLACGLVACGLVSCGLVSVSQLCNTRTSPYVLSSIIRPSCCRTCLCLVEQFKGKFSSLV